MFIIPDTVPENSPRCPWGPPTQDRSSFLEKHCGRQAVERGKRISRQRGEKGARSATEHSHNGDERREI